MTEDVLYQWWERSAVPGRTFHCLGLQRLLVLSAGRRNNGPGPDYLDAVLCIDGVIRFGHVEMHIQENDWFLHGHHNDPAYQPVMLHVLGVRPQAAVLDLPTLIHDDAVEHDAADHARPMPGEVRLSADLLSECAWARLVRRAVEILRSGRHLPLADCLRRGFVRRMMDCLGYQANRHPMQIVCQGLFAREHELFGYRFEEMAALVYGLSHVDRERWMGLGQAFMRQEWLDRMTAMAGPHPLWHYEVRPANLPERRLWAAAKLLFDVYRAGMIADAFGVLIDTASLDRVTSLFRVTLGGYPLVGFARANEISMNALLPAALAFGAVLKDPVALLGVCRAYRYSPSLATNRIVRRMESEYLGGHSFTGGFWQQGAIEFWQRYRNPDRSALSFVAEQTDGGGEAQD